MTGAGTVSIVAGLVFFVWAARVAGWRRACGLTSQPRHPEEPQLVIGGPFRVARHPVALAAILMLAGFALVCRSLLCSAAAGLASAAIALAARRSERALSERFGDPYRRYREAVPFLLPRPWRRGSASRTLGADGS